MERKHAAVHREYTERGRRGRQRMYEAPRVRARAFAVDCASSCPCSSLASVQGQAAAGRRRAADRVA